MSELVQTAVPLFNMTLLLALLILSRRWSTPHLERRVTILENEQRSINGKLGNMDRDLNALIRSGVEAEEHLAKEIDAVKAMLEGKVSMRRQFEALADQMTDLKSAVQAVPCIARGSTEPDCPSD